MFKSIQLYKNQEISQEEIFHHLLDFGYQNQASVAEEGDFSHRGLVVDVFPLNFQDPVRIEFDEEKIISIKNFDLASGKNVLEHQMLIILPIRGISRRKIKRPFFEFGEQVPINNFVDIEADNYVVHIEHGIGIYKGIAKLKIGKRFQDHIAIEYAENNMLYVPMEEIHLIQKYIGFEGRPPKLYKLGTRLWQKVKKQAQEGARSVALELLELEAKRSAIGGFEFSKDTDWQKRVEDAFPYDETPDQLKATLEIKQDMESARPMDRLICGDVGYGKTEVALRAAFKAMMDNKQVAVLVPTTILAEQHYNTFANRLKDFPVNAQMLSRFKTELEQKKILVDLKEGRVDTIIGTHRLLSPDVAFKDLGLVIIDEEQRFGVRHKERLKKLRFSVDVLTLTATPIPRTLYMSLMGAKDISIINTPPPDRLPIQTQVCRFNDATIKQAITLETQRAGQIYFIHNRIEDIEKVGNRLRSLFPDVKFAVAHGRLAPRELELVMLDFMRGKIACLVSTAIVESGIDIPNANTIIINNADKFGLADLYQLRGRVGRFKRKAYAYFLVHSKEILSKDAKKRLSALKKFAKLGSGFKLAMEDLQLRGAGNILGIQQHGYVNSVGFDLYCRLLRQIVNTLKVAPGKKNLFVSV